MNKCLTKHQFNSTDSSRINHIGSIITMKVFCFFLTLSAISVGFVEAQSGNIILELHFKSGLKQILVEGRLAHVNWGDSSMMSISVLRAQKIVRIQDWHPLYPQVLRTGAKSYRKVAKMSEMAFSR